MPSPKIVLVTGASSGFGRETAVLLSQHGFRVFGTSRNSSPKDVGAGVEMVQLDVDSDESVSRTIESVVAKTGGLDVLVNNAGFVLTGGIEETSVDEAKAQLETNFFGAARMVKAVLPVMRKRGAGQIINVSSVAAWLPVPFEGYYAAAKAALVAYSDALRHEVKSFGISVSVVEPGFFRTNLVPGRRTVRSLIGDYGKLRLRAVGALEDDFSKGGDPKVVAETILHIVESRSPRFEHLVGVSGRYRVLKQILPQSMFDGAVRRHWKLDKSE